MNPPIKRPESRFGVLFLGSEPESTWQIDDPTDETTLEAYGQCRGAAYPHRVYELDGSPVQPKPDEMVSVRRSDLRRVLGLAEAYLFLGTYELGVECVIGKLREIRRALRAMGRAT